MASLTAGTTFTDGVANDVTAAKLGALVTNATPTSGFIQDRTAETVVAVNDTLLIGDASDSNNLKRMTVANLLKAPLVSTSGTIDVLTTGTTTSTAEIVTSGTIATLNSTTGTIATLNSTTGTIATLNSTTGTITNLSATTSTFLGTITGSTNVINIGSGQIYKDASGNVGVGTSSPAYKLDVNGEIRTSNIIRGTYGDSAYLVGGASNNNNNIFVGGGSSATPNIIAATTNGTERLRIDSSGNVGIGTTSPAQKLEVAGSSPAIKISATSNASAQLLFNSNAGGTQKDTGSIIYGNDENLTFRTASTERLRIDASGNVGIGTTSPARKFHISGSDGPLFRIDNGATDQYYEFGRNSTTGYLTFLGAQTNYSGYTFQDNNGSSRLTIQNGGNVGIGVTAPVNKLEVVGSFGRGAPVTKTGDFTLADTENWIIVNKGSAGTATLPAASSWTGREFTIKVITAHTVVSASSNVVPRNSATAGTAILAAAAGNWATLVSNGTAWVIMCGS